MRQPSYRYENKYITKTQPTPSSSQSVVVVSSSNADDVKEGLINCSSSDNNNNNKLKQKKKNKQRKMKKRAEEAAAATHKMTMMLKKKNNKKEKKNKQLTVENEDDADTNHQQQTDDANDTMDVAKSHKKVKKSASNKKRKVAKQPEAETIEAVVSTVPDEVHESKSSDTKRNKKTSKSKKTKRDKESRKKDGAGQNVSHSTDADQQTGTLKSTSQIDNGSSLFDDEDEVYEMSSGDEDETTGMKRWITKYHRARPGAEVLMENINDFLVDYAAHKEREKKEREEEAAEGGWTVVGQHKGRKKTTEAESGTTVGSVAPAAVMDKLSKKKDKQVGINFYRFQKREAQRNEIMMLQSKFEQDKKRIQELRAARKFRPY